LHKIIERMGDWGKLSKRRDHSDEARWGKLPGRLLWNVREETPAKE